MTSEGRLAAADTRLSVGGLVARRRCPIGARGAHTGFAASLKIVALAAAMTPAALAQDFSEMHLRDGRDAFRGGRPAEAIQPLRIAVFGLLDRPALMCEALVYLALSQEKMGLPEDAQSSLERLAAAESGSPACAQAALDAPTRLEFETTFHHPLFPGPAAAGNMTAPALPAARRSPAAPPTPGRSSASAAPTRTPVPAPPRPRQTASTPEIDAVAANPSGGTAARVKRTAPAYYPRAAHAARVGGTVVLRVLVSEEGRPTDFQVVKGVRADLRDAAISSVRNWLFEPAVVEGRAVRSWVVVEIPFQP